MASVQFYQVQGTTPGDVDAVLPLLLSKILQTGQKAVIRCPSLERRDRLNSWLWAYEATSFLPHAVAEDGQSDQQPVFLTTDGTQPNEARVLIVLGGVSVVEEVGSSTLYDKILDVFDSSENQTTQARHRWKGWKAVGMDLAYYAQAENGWQKRG